MIVKRRELQNIHRAHICFHHLSKDPSYIKIWSYTNSSPRLKVKNGNNLIEKLLLYSIQIKYTQSTNKNQSCSHFFFIFNLPTYELDINMTFFVFKIIYFVIYITSAAQYVCTKLDILKLNTVYTYRY